MSVAGSAHSLSHTRSRTSVSTSNLFLGRDTAGFRRARRQQFVLVLTQIWENSSRICPENNGYEVLNSWRMLDDSSDPFSTVECGR
jgi:hypothetical protein